MSHFEIQSWPKDFSWYYPLFIEDNCRLSHRSGISKAVDTEARRALKNNRQVISHMDKAGEK